MKIATAVLLGAFASASSGVFADAYHDHRNHDAAHGRGWGYHHQATESHDHHRDKAYSHYRQANKHYRKALSHEHKARSHERNAHRQDARERVHYSGNEYRRDVRQPSQLGRVISVEPIYRAVSRPVSHDSCLRSSGAPDYSSHTATVLGAVLGGTLGHRIGDAHGDPEVAAIAGGLLGATIGHDLGRRHAYNRTLRAEGPCRVKHDTVSARELVEYKVTYRYNGREHQAYMDHDPGEWVKLDVDVAPA